MPQLHKIAASFSCCANVSFPPGPLPQIVPYSPKPVDGILWCDFRDRKPPKRHSDGRPSDPAKFQIWGGGMQLRLESRPVGDVLLIQCHGRIVAGNEVYTLHAQVGDSLVKYSDVVLQLDTVEFVDSSGLGALVRLTQSARAKGGDLKRNQGHQRRR